MEEGSYYPEELTFPLTDAPALCLPDDENATNPEMYVYMDIQDPIETLKTILERKTGKSLKGYTVLLQQMQMLEPHKTLVDQCVKGEGLVQVNVEIYAINKQINITDVVKPTEEALRDLEQEANDINPDSDVAIMNYQNANSNDSAVTVSSGNVAATVNSMDEDEGSSQDTVNWVVDQKFLLEKKRLNIPDDPKTWQRQHVKIWLEWAINQFNLSINMKDWNLNGKELCEMTLQEFQLKVPKDSGLLAIF